MPDINVFFNPWKMLVPNLALSSLAGNLDPKHVVGIADLVLKRHNVRKAVVAAVKRIRPDLVALSAMTFQYDTAVRVARLIRDLSPGVRVALGGYHATLMYAELTKNTEAGLFDFLFRGEADLSFNELVNALEEGGDLRSIDGLSFREGDIFVHNKPRELEDLGTIALPNRQARIWRGYHALGKPFDAIESSRGCLMGCTFCSIRRMYGKSFRKYETARVLEDIGRAKSLGARAMFFTDDNITLDPDQFDALLEGIIGHGHQDVTYYVQASSRGLADSEETVRKMSRAGFRFVFLGIENVSRKNLMALHKGDILEKSVRAVESLKRHGMFIIGGLIVGNPEDDESDIEENYRFADRLGISVFDQILTPYLKTELRNDLLERGLVTNSENYKYYNGHFANVRTRHLSDRQLDRIKYRMGQKYAWPLHTLFLAKRREFSIRLLPLMAKGLPKAVWRKLAPKLKHLHLTEEQLFLEDHERCLRENDFNL